MKINSVQNNKPAFTSKIILPNKTLRQQYSSSLNELKNNNNKDIVIIRVYRDALKTLEVLEKSNDTVYRTKKPIALNPGSNLNNAYLLAKSNMYELHKDLIPLMKNIF